MFKILAVRGNGTAVAVALAILLSVGAGGVPYLLAADREAQGEPDSDLNLPESTVPVPEDGAIVAQKLCVGCHIIEPGDHRAAQADVPSFPEIADRPNQSFDSLSGWLMSPHAPMPDPHLTRKEVRDLAGYILSLRSRP